MLKCLADGVTFRFHHMMKECANRVFAALDEEKQAFYLNRFGLWYEQHSQYLHAMDVYRRSKNYDAFLRVVKNDAGILLASLNAQEVMNVLAECPVSILKAHPLAILVLMRSMFNWRLIPKMMELKVLLMEVDEENAALSDEDVAIMLGDADLIMSFLCYNDIGANESAALKSQQPDVQTGHQYSEQRRLDLWIAFCADDVLPAVRDSWKVSLPRWMNVCRIITRLPVVTDRGQKRLCGQKQLLCREDLRMHRLSWNGLMHRLKEMARKIWRFAVIFWHGDWLWLRK